MKTDSKLNVLKLPQQPRQILGPHKSTEDMLDSRLSFACIQTMNGI